jgi:hypothetical protein
MPEYFIGLDLGQSADYSALAVLRREEMLDKAGAPRRNHRGKRVFDYTCVWLERYELGLSYVKVVEKVRTLLERPKLQEPTPTLVLDANGCGRAVVDQIIDANLLATIVPVTITGGTGEPRKEQWNGSGIMSYHVTKTDLVGCVRAALESGRMTIVTAGEKT